jgi:hypothetical protein
MRFTSMVGAAAGYLRQHPEEFVRAARNAVGRRVGVPLDALRWLAAELQGGPRDVELRAVPPGLRVAATIDLMGNTVRAAALVFVEAVELSASMLRVEVRLEDVSLELLDAVPDSPVAMLLDSGVLDLSKPGNLAAHVPRRPAFLVEAKDDRVVLDLMRLPRLAASPALRKAIGVMLAVLTVRGVETDWEHLDVVFVPLPSGVRHVVASARAAAGR